MAKCLRLALSATTKYLQNHGSVPLAQYSLLRLPVCQARMSRQITVAAVAPLMRRSSPVLTAAVKGCTCKSTRRQMNTEVDKELSKFLEKEISYEESQAGKSRLQVKGIEGFDVSTKDADVTLTRKLGNETVVVKFTVNASVDAAGGLQGGDQEAEPEMVSQPPFSVEISKGDGRTLSLQCNFVAPDEMAQEGQQDAEQIVDSFEIQEVALHTGEWKDTVYSVQADIMDGNLYDLLMDMLDERGINDEFANQLIEFSTTYEHGKYVDFLKGLKSFVEK